MLPWEPTARVLARLLVGGVASFLGLRRAGAEDDGNDGVPNDDKVDDDDDDDDDGDRIFPRGVDGQWKLSADGKTLRIGIPICGY